jgi:hypothetical protein
MEHTFDENEIKIEICSGTSGQEHRVLTNHVLIGVAIDNSPIKIPDEESLRCWELLHF